MFAFVIILGTSVGTGNFGSFKSIMEGHSACKAPSWMGFTFCLVSALFLNFNGTSDSSSD
jgi:hypothetical protein